MFALAFLFVLPLCATESINFFVNGEKYGVRLDANRKRDTLKCSVGSVSSLGETAQEVSREELTRLKRFCKDQRSLELPRRSKRAGGALINIIAPGTKWCGTGHVAKNYDDLGSKEATDACCRAHDKCKPTIGGFGRKGTLINFLPWSRLHCDCDSAFYTCLKDARKTEKTTADLVGKTYFNLLSTKCFKETTEKVCVKLGWFKCAKYKTINTYKWASTKKY